MPSSMTSTGWARWWRTGSPVMTTGRMAMRRILPERRARTGPARRAARRLLRSCDEPRHRPRRPRARRRPHRRVRPLRRATTTCSPPPPSRRPRPSRAGSSTTAARSRCSSPSRSCPATTCSRPSRCWRTVVPTARRLVAAHWSHFLADAPALRGGLAKGKYDAFLLMPRGVRDEEFHTAICELLSDWGSTVATPEVETVRIVTPGPGRAHPRRSATSSTGWGCRTAPTPPDSEQGRDVHRPRRGTPAYPLVEAVDRVIFSPTSRPRRRDARLRHPDRHRAG